MKFKILLFFVIFQKFSFFIYLQTFIANKLNLNKWLIPDVTEISEMIFANNEHFLSKKNYISANMLKILGVYFIVSIVFKNY